MGIATYSTTVFCYDDRGGTVSNQQPASGNHKVWHETLGTVQKEVQVPVQVTSISIRSSSRGSAVRVRRAYQEIRHRVWAVQSLTSSSDHFKLLSGFLENRYVRRLLGG